MAGLADVDFEDITVQTPDVLVARFDGEACDEDTGQCTADCQLACGPQMGWRIGSSATTIVQLRLGASNGDFA